ncbi:hypothetical protein [Nocardia sp. NPDC057227]|uniref:hypothetical protein n=1 Tax=Nocardia sp. NPDC057227 TaxID=3346056 RepID=UPI0036358524
MARRWRDEATQQAQDDIDALFAVAMDLVEKQLGSHRGFIPFALAVDHHGARSLRTAPAAAATRSAIIDALILDTDRGTHRALAIVLDVTVPPTDTDAAEFVVEHAEGTALQIVVPYTIDGNEGGQVHVERATTAEGQRRIWGLHL